MENTPTITLADSKGRIQTYKVNNALLMQVWEVLSNPNNGDAELIKPLELPEAETGNGNAILSQTKEPVNKNVLDAPHTIKQGTKSGYVELFYSKIPSAVTREILKKHGYRFTRANAHWYGLQSKLPEEYLGLDVAPRAVTKSKVKRTRTKINEPEKTVKTEPEKTDSDFMDSLTSLMNQTKV